MTGRPGLVLTQVVPRRNAHVLPRRHGKSDVSATGQHQQLHGGLNARLVGGIESIGPRAIKVKDTQEPFAIDHRHHQFRTRRRIAGDVSRELMHVGHQHALTALRRRTAHAPTHGNAHTGRLTLKWPEHQLLSAQEIKAGPVQIGQTVEHESREIRAIGDKVRFAGQQAGNRPLQVRVTGGTGSDAAGSLGYQERTSDRLVTPAYYDGRAVPPQCSLVATLHEQPLGAEHYCQAFLDVESFGPRYTLQVGRRARKHL